MHIWLLTSSNFAICYHQNENIQLMQELQANNRLCKKGFVLPRPGFGSYYFKCREYNFCGQLSRVTVRTHPNSLSTQNRTDGYNPSVMPSADGGSAPHTLSLHAIGNLFGGYLHNGVLKQVQHDHCIIIFSPNTTSSYTSYFAHW